MARLAKAVSGLALIGAVALPALSEWPPAVRPDPKAAGPLTPQESLATIVVPPGYRVELVAHEPLVQDPILIDFDADGRMWVVEMPGFASEDGMQDSRRPICRVAVLEDTDDDGVMDRRTVFADGLVLPRAIKTVEHGALVGEPPNLWLMRDGDGDLVADAKQLVTNTFGTREGNPEHNANSLVWGLDNWIHTSEHDFDLRFTRSGFEVVKTLARGQWGGSIDDAGRLFRNVNNSPLFVDLTPARYFIRNPDLVRTRGLYESLLTLEQAESWPVRPSRGVNRGYRDQFFREDGTSRILQSVATPVVFRGDRLPPELRGGVFVTDSTTHLLHWLVLEDDGHGRLRAQNGFPRGEIFASTDERVRPVSAMSAPDGTLYVVDMYRGVVQDVAYQTEYLQDYIVRHGLAAPTHQGRIYRIASTSLPRDRRPALSRETPRGLVAYLSHANGWWRDTAQQLIVQRQDASVVPALRTLVREASDWRTRLHALGALAGLDALDAGLLRPLLAHERPEVRAWAIRWSEPWLAKPGHPQIAAVLRLTDDPSWTVRWQLAASIGELPEAARLEPALALLARYGSDPITVDTIVSGLHGLEETALDRVLARGAEPEASDAVAMLSGALARSAQVGPVERAIARVTATARSGWQRLALLRGLELGFGGRDVRGGPPRAATRRSLSLAAEPAALTRLAATSDEVGRLARDLVARLDWPGKPAVRAEAPAQTDEEKTRFEAGRRLYANLCIACHRADGRGGEQAPSLAGSALVVGDPGVPTRIVLAGKEGDIGLMPPLNTLTDEQLAAVLSYVRWEWGNQAASVRPEDVREVRGATASRTRPWTREELTKP